MSKETNLKRGRPRKFDPDHAVEVAQALFHAHGYDNVGVVRLAKEIGIEQPSLYAAFRNKLGIFKAVTDRYAGNEGAFIASAFGSASEVSEGLRSMLAIAAELYSRNEGGSGCLIMEGAHGTHDEGARTVCADKRTATQTFIQDYIETEYPSRGAEVAGMVMIALAGLSSSARAGMTGDQLLKFSSIAGDGIHRMLQHNTSPDPRTD